MRKPNAVVIAILGALVLIGWLLVQRSLDPDRRNARGEAGAAGAPAGSGARNGPAGAPGESAGEPGGGDGAERAGDRTGDARDDVVYEPGDVEIFRETVAWARAEGLDTVGLGAAIVGIGRRFVGDPYTPHTLDPPGDERLVVNLREFDCVTFVESVLAMARVVRAGRTDFHAFTDELRRIRYRGGRLDGYVSRLHYFSEWIADNEGLGVVRDVTRELGGIRDEEPIDFISAHADAYGPLDGHPERVERIRAIERRLGERARYFIPQDRIGASAGGIRDGDIIAATSSVEGLDVAHTGFAIHVDGRLHLMHAPLVGKSLEISERPLAERILPIEGQDGIMVARPR